jgi:hypothetical protein
MLIAGRCAAVVLAAGLAAGVAEGRPHPPARPADLSGVWSTASLTDLERPDDFKALVATEAEAARFEKAHRGKVPDIGDKDNPVGGPESEWWETDVGLARIRGQVRTSWIVAPANGKRPFNAAAKAARMAVRARFKRPPENPEDRDTDERCFGVAAGAPLANSGINDNLQFVQTPDQLLIYAEWMHDTRIVRIGDAVHPPPAVRVAGGDSIGPWEGDALVVETTNFSADEVAAPDGDPAADMRVVERFTRTSPNEIAYAYSVTNPARFSQTWQVEMVLHPANGRIFEYACHEGNYGLFNMLAAARRLEGRRIEGGPGAH